jgi:hypothetical protein
MDLIHFGRWQVSTDREATKQAYAAISRSGSETCPCKPCLNFLAAREHVYPADVLGLFETLGISFDRECEIYHMARLSSGKHLYGGWFHFVGSIVSGADAAQQIGENLWQPSLEKVNDDFTLGFSSRIALPESPFFGKPIVQVEFTANVPWLISEPEPE